MDGKPRQRSIGILYPGEMGSSLGGLLQETGVRVFTATEERSTRTKQMCREAGLTVLPNLLAVLEQSDLVISTVTPGSALAVARSVAEHRTDRMRSLIYVDANAISPKTVDEIAAVLKEVSADLVDASIFGLATQLRSRGAIYLSGERAQEVAELFRSPIKVEVVGNRPGHASAMKMIVSAIPKGLSALFIETMLLAEEMDMLEESLAAFTQLYPSMMEVVSRTLPTYPQHAGRRCEELAEAEQTIIDAGLTPRIVAAVRKTTLALSKARWEDGMSPGKHTVAEIIRLVQRTGTLKQPTTMDQEPQVHVVTSGGEVRTTRRERRGSMEQLPP